MLYLMLGLLLAVATILGALILWVEKQDSNSLTGLTIKTNNAKK